MEKIGCGHAPAVLRKEKKKKQAKDELDRLKQAERKKRRLEKALATSAAIRSELEKKKLQKKKEEQQRLDEEGAAIAEAVALHVLLGEDSDDSRLIMLNKNKKMNPPDYSGNIGIIVDCQSFRTHEGQEGVANAYGLGCKYNDWRIECSMTNGMHGIGLQMPCFEGAYQTAEISAGIIAAQALSSLRIADGAQDDHFIPQNGATAAVINRMLEGSGFNNEVNLYGDFWAT